MVFLYRRNPSLEVLLLKRKKTGKGDWHPITGNVEAHEAIPTAAARETKEETGIGIVPEPLGVTHTYELDGDRYHETAFCALERKDARNKNGRHRDSRQRGNRYFTFKSANANRATRL